MYIQAFKSLISKFLQVKKMETELLKKGVDKELINYAKRIIFIRRLPQELHTVPSINIHIF